MGYKYNIKTGVKKFRSMLVIAISTLVLAGSSLPLLLAGSAHAMTLNGCNFDDTTPGIWSLEGDCMSTDQINVPSDTTLVGNGHTISTNLIKNGNDHNAVLGIISSDNVTVEDLIIDGSGGTNLHGINVYVSTSVNLNNVSVFNNDNNGLVVNGSTVTVDSITTGGNGWGAVDVDQGGGVTAPAALTINGHSTHGETVQVYVDNMTKGSVVDTLSQYYVTHPLGTDALYTLQPTGEITSPTTGETISGDVNLTATYNDSDNLNDDIVQWAVRAGTCAAGQNTVWGNVDSHSDPYTWVGGNFSSVFHSTSVADGSYCFIFNPKDDAGQNDVRETVTFTVNNTVDNKDECKDGGWASFTNPSFKNQGQCIAYVNHHDGHGQDDDHARLGQDVSSEDHGILGALHRH